MLNGEKITYKEKYHSKEWDFIIERTYPAEAPSKNKKSIKIPNQKGYNSEVPNQKDNDNATAKTKYIPPKQPLNIERRRQIENILIYLEVGNIVAIKTDNAYNFVVAMRKAKGLLLKKHPQIRLKKFRIWNATLNRIWLAKDTHCDLTITRMADKTQLDVAHKVHINKHTVSFVTKP